VGDEEGVLGSDAKLTAIDTHQAKVAGKSKDQRMPLGRFHRPKTKATRFWNNLSLPK
jgi:hypothetical protein